ncbi:MAG: hypothetical protein QJT81_13395 [Candidatus Thiothrix putei]|uniref:Uncharacterized protein n=1 Tax=Candidatus Thiothrix putei TaxID=3080811 RepID=A0AA95HCY3_9GAMM|nr:MAG: hypothetical protein QJT81_13395 [Candidatus Thiothrix putei]
MNAIQTVSRLNRKRADKEQDDLLVVDFTNSSEAIFKAFNQFRQGSPYKEQEPDKAVLEAIYQQVLAMGAFDAAAVQHCVNAYTSAENAAKQRHSDADALFSNTKQAYRKQFNQRLLDAEARKVYIALLLTHNRDNILFLEQYEPTLHSEIRMGYMDRDLWGQLQNPIYTDKGGIIPIMGKTIIQQVVQLAA